MGNLPMSIGAIIVILAILYFMFRGSMDRYGEKARYRASGGLRRLKRWVLSGSRAY